MHRLLMTSHKQFRGVLGAKPPVLAFSFRVWVLVSREYDVLQPVYTRDRSQWDRSGSICIDYWGSFTHGASSSGQARSDRRETPLKHRKRCTAAATVAGPRDPRVY